MKKRIYVVDDEPKLGQLFVNVLDRDGYDAKAFVSPTAMLATLEPSELPDMVLSDLMMPEMNGIELMQSIQKRGFDVPVIIMTAHSSVQTAVEAMRLGALHYLQKPVNLEEMRTLLARSLDLYAAKQELEALQRTQREQFAVGSIRGDSEPIRAVRRILERLRTVPYSTVLLRGETGTGKNLVAKTIHFNSPQHAGRFLEINCAALPDNLLEAELFGYEKGAFTDARAAKPGLLEMADGGTVFLDEVDSMTPALQSKLLTFLESRCIRRLGGLEDLRVSTRVICATNADLEARVKERHFRADLFYRINVVSIRLPALREMGRDVISLAEEIVEEFNGELGRDVRGFTPDAEEKLLAHSWPGNVRELRNVIERAMIFASTPRLDAASLVITPGDGETPVPDGAFTFPDGQTLEALEKAYIHHTMKTARTLTDVATTLGISKKTLWEKRKRYDLNPEWAATER